VSSKEVHYLVEKGKLCPHYLIALHKSTYALRPNETSKHHRHLICKGRLKKFWLFLRKLFSIIVMFWSHFLSRNSTYQRLHFFTRTHWKRIRRFLAETKLFCFLWLRTLYLFNIFLTMYLVVALQTSDWRTSSTTAFAARQTFFSPLSLAIPGSPLSPTTF